ncbi:TetR/AcrR family transcriptional regulator [Clostridioides sp. ZZV15-6598]|uniref:TetR/AcrR family transcriptional regulator n=1 Tax=Clostridioides sp. ZZV15-6598 TaxID=2811501 RepID=UPI001D0FFF3C|nr:TetR/AcrR family transcriptional regulator [Clostridioides sp. ZZV15-6598]
MARTNVNFDSKKQELLTSIWQVLLKYGYEQMSISIIIKELSISRGAFYHYFQSKEECVDLAIGEYVSQSVTILRNMDNYSECAVIRLQQAIKNGISLFHDNIEQSKVINEPENAIFHQKLMIAFTKYMSPFYASIIKDGVISKEFETSFPLEVAEMLLTLSNFYLDNVLFQWEANSMKNKIKALEELVNKSLGTEKYIAFFDFITMEVI